MTDYREQIAEIITGEAEMVDGKPDGLHQFDIDNNLPKADQILSIPITRPCRECGGEKWIWVNHGSEGYQQDVCPTCTNGLETTTIKNLIEEWLR